MGGVLRLAVFVGEGAVVVWAKLRPIAAAILLLALFVRRFAYRRRPTVSLCDHPLLDFPIPR